MSHLPKIVTLGPMITPHPPAGPTLGGWLQEQIEVDRREAAALHSFDCEVWTLAAQRDDSPNHTYAAWCTCSAKQAMRAASSKAHILGLALAQYQDEDDSVSLLGWQLMKYLALHYYDRPGNLAALPHGQYTRWHR